MNTKVATLSLLAFVVLYTLPVAAAAQARSLTVADYQHAEKFLGINTRPLLDHDVSRVRWVDDDHFWYVEHDAEGDHFRTADAATGTISPAFDQDKMAATLSKAMDKPIKAGKLPISDFSVTDKGLYDISMRGKHFLCDLSGKAECTAKAKAKAEKTRLRLMLSRAGCHQTKSPRPLFATGICGYAMWPRGKKRN